MAGTQTLRPDRESRSGRRRRRRAPARRLDGLGADYEDLLVALVDARADFVVVGAHAVAFHGAARRTTDLDLLIRPGWRNAMAVVSALRACGAPVDPGKLSIEDVARFGVAYDLVAPPRHVDLLTEISGVDFDQAWRGSSPARVRSRRLAVLGWKALVHNKRATGRLKDLVDVDRLEREGSRSAVPGCKRSIA